MASKNKKSNTMGSYVRSFTFGVEDSLASTVGLLSGIASANLNNSAVILTGVVLIITEALSMGVGSFLSEQSVSEYNDHKDKPLAKSIPAAVIMFASYLLAGLIPLSPYAFFKYPTSMELSISATLVGLVFLGLINAHISKTSAVRGVLRMVIMGGSVTIAGVLAGMLLK